MLHAQERKYLEAVGLLSFATLFLFVARALAAETLRYWFIPENLLLAWVSLLAAWLLVRSLKNRRWLSWQNILLSILWLFFLPNSWYVLTDFIHVYPTGEVSEIYDIALIGLLVLTGFTLGFTSLYLIHKELLLRFSHLAGHLMIASVLLLSSFAIYLGRHLRWSTWDVITNPGGIILNVTDRLIDPMRYSTAISTTLLLFFVLSLIYIAVWRLLREPKK